MSAEVPKLQRRLPLGDAACFGDRPPAEMVVVLAEAVALGVRPYLPVTAGKTAIDHSAIAFPAKSRFEYV
jgi:hypothetical protein